MPSPENITVTFKQMSGEYRSRLGMKTRHYPVDNIFLNGQEIGQLGHQPNAGIIFYGKFEEQLMERVAAEVKRLKPHATGKFNYPPTQEQVIEAIDVLVKEAEEAEEENDATDVVEE